MPTFEQRREHYTKLWKGVLLDPQRRPSVATMANKVTVGRARYEKISEATGIPWWWIGCVHARESACHFGRHLHNGDSLQSRTRRVPANRPNYGKGPYTWEESALDALRMKGLHKIAEWTIERALYEWERYNGFGYVKPGRPNSPYLWAGTTNYSKGKYVADHVYDPEHEDEQQGTVAILRAMMERDPEMLDGSDAIAVAVQAPPAMPPTPKQEHETAHEALKETSVWYRLKRRALKLLGIGGATTSGSLALIAKDDPLGTVERVASMLFQYGLFIAAGALVLVIIVETMQWREREAAIEGGDDVQAA